MREGTLVGEGTLVREGGARSGKGTTWRAQCGRGGAGRRRCEARARCGVRVA